MKKIYKFILVALVGTACVYTACKKTQVTSTQQSATTLAIGKQIALGLYKAIESKYGGAGSQIPASIAQSKGPRINDLNPYCGYTVDTAFSTPSTAHDTSIINSGHFRIVYGCSNNQVNSYIMVDSTSSTYSGALFLNINKVVQSDTVTVDSTYTNALLYGTITSSAHNAALANNVVTGYNDVSSQYNLSNMHVTFSNGSGNITSGTSLFATYATQVGANNATTTTTYTGSITFNGNNMATMVLNFNNTTTTYSINMLTGTLTQL